MIGRTVSHYRIIEKLGEGGMGVVYKAEDVKLKRTVALKFLPPELTRDHQAKARFIHEAQAASSLQHNNIGAIHEIDETGDGQMFICMDYYEGETLKKSIEHGPLEVKEAIHIAVQVAQGLLKAHESGIVHRDVKPANIMVTRDGIAKIIDFGLAKLAGQVKLTKTGFTVGTTAYMSPELIKGEEIDQRADLFSFGTMLYEMVAGHLPFSGEHEAALSYSIVNEAPLPLKTWEIEAPPGLEKVIDRCLEKDREKRYQRGDEIVSDLQTVQREMAPAIKAKRKAAKIPILIGGVAAVLALIVLGRFFLLPEPVSSSEKSIAVLPFVDMSPQKDQEYFCDGMTEELINRLSNIKELKVPARTSVFRFKGKSQDIRDIGQKLNVQTVLEGSIRKADSRLRITAQLINIADGYHIWSETYDRELKDVFAIQDEISSAITDALELKLTPKERQRLIERPIDNVAAYECYLKASNEIWRFSESSLDSARLYLQRGLDIAGDNALLYSAMADVYWQYVNIGAGQEDYIAKAESYARKALALDPDFPKANAALAAIYKDFLGNQPKAIRHYQRALAVSPKEPDALRKLSYAYVVTVGKPSAALPLMQRARQVDPLDSWNDLIQGVFYLYDGQYGLALEQHRKFYQSDPENPLAQFFYSWALACNKEHDAAFAVIDQSAKTTPDNVCTKFGLLMKHGLLKDKAKVFREITPDFQRTCKRDPEWSYYVGLMLALLDAKDKALDWLENAVNRGFINYPELKRNPYLDNLRGEERFKKLMERVKYEWEHFEV